MVDPQLVHGTMRLLSGSGELAHAPFGALFGPNELLNFLKVEAVLEVVVGCVFLHDILGYAGIFQSFHQGVPYHFFCVGGLAHMGRVKS